MRRAGEEEREREGRGRERERVGWGGGGGGGGEGERAKGRGMRRKGEEEERGRQRERESLMFNLSTEEKVDDIGPLEADKGDIRSDPLSLPEHSTWDDIDLLDDAQVSQHEP